MWTYFWLNGGWTEISAQQQKSQWCRWSVFETICTKETLINRRYRSLEEMAFCKSSGTPFLSSEIWQTYCWWKKSCTSWYGEYPIYPITYRVLDGLASSQVVVSLGISEPSTVSGCWDGETQQEALLHLDINFGRFTPSPPDSSDVLGKHCWAPGDVNQHESTTGTRGSRWIFVGFHFRLDPPPPSSYRAYPMKKKQYDTVTFKSLTWLDIPWNTDWVISS